MHPHEAGTTHSVGCQSRGEAAKITELCYLLSFQLLAPAARWSQETTPGGSLMSYLEKVWDQIEKKAPAVSGGSVGGSTVIAFLVLS